MDAKHPHVSVIIPCKSVDKYAEECVRHTLELDYPSFEVILLPDFMPSNFDAHSPRLRIIPTGPVLPSVKRNMGIGAAKGSIIAFEDSDAYPRKDWLKNALKYFKNSEMAAVGGPGLTPEDDSFLQKAGGYVTSSFMVGGLSRRYKTKTLKEVDDVHSCNFIAHRSAIEKAGGWNEYYWPGEDTLICLAIKKSGSKILEANDVVVYHHRKPLFAEHLRQVSRFGLHRGFFARKFGGNSLHLTYFTPSISLMTFIFLGALSTSIRATTYLLVILAVTYLAASLSATLLETRNKKMIPIVWAGIILTHLTYGISFIAGLIKLNLKR